MQFVEYTIQCECVRQRLPQCIPVVGQQSASVADRRVCQRCHTNCTQLKHAHAYMPIWCCRQQIRNTFRTLFHCQLGTENNLNRRLSPSIENDRESFWQNKATIRSRASVFPPYLFITYISFGCAPSWSPRAASCPWTMRSLLLLDLHWGWTSAFHVTVTYYHFAYKLNDRDSRSLVSFATQHRERHSEPTHRGRLSLSDMGHWHKVVQMWTIILVDFVLQATSVESSIPDYSLTDLQVVNVEPDRHCTVDRTDLSHELRSFPAPRITNPTPAVTRPGAWATCDIVTQSRMRWGRGINIKPEERFLAHVAISPGTCEWGLWAITPPANDVASQYTSGDSP